jgi:hypothetical protein
MVWGIWRRAKGVYLSVCLPVRGFAARTVQSAHLDCHMLAGGAMTQVVSLCLSTRSAGFESRSVDVGSLVAKVALGEVSFLVLRFI